MIPAEPRPYLPTRLVARLEGAPGAGERAFIAVSTAGVVYFVDISGFTKLTDRLDETKGGAGIDQLARVVGEKFATIVERIEAHGGEVVAFAGDAVLAWWEAETASGQEEALLRAVACSRRVEGDLATPIEGLTVQVRQAIAVGGLRAMRVGDAPCVALLDGEAVSQLAEVAGGPAGGPAALTAAAQRLAAGPRRSPPPASAPAPPLDLVDRLPGDPPEELPVDLPVARLHKYVDPLLRAGASGIVRSPELRVVTAMFVRFADTVHEPERVHAAVSAAEREITRHRGSVISVGRDDKGIVVAAAFGLPAREVFHPADPARAAIALTAALDRLGIGAGIGLATGRTYFGASLFGDRHRFDVIGSPMNLASRLMMLGLGAWCDPATARGARGAVRLADGRALRFKGFSRPITAWRLVDLATEGGDHPFVGRAEALARVSAAIDGARAGVGGRLYVAGEPGIGKSALLRQVRTRALLAGLQVLELGGGPADAPLGAWAPAVRAALGASGDLRLALEAALGPDAGLACLLGPMLGLAIAETAAAADLRGFPRTTKAAELVASLLGQRPAAGGRVLIADDYPSLDERSVEVVERLEQRGVLAVLSSRAKEIGGPGGTIQLGPLRRDEVTDLVRAVLGDGAMLGELPPGLLDWLMVRASGHPQFTLELLAVAQERGFLELDPAGRVLYFDRAGLEATTPPDTVQAALATRLDQLPQVSADALKAASAIGVEVPRELLERLVPTDLDSAVQPLIDAGWLVPVASGYRFSQPASLEAVHSLLVREQRRRIHGALAEALAGPLADPAVLANHLAHAGAIPAAIAQLDRAWARAMEGCLPRTAAQMALRVLSLDDESVEFDQRALAPGLRAQWHYRVAVACRGYGDTATATTHLDAAAHLLGLRFPETLGGWRTLLLREVALHALERLVPVRSRPGDALQASVLNLLSLAAYLRSRPAEQLLYVAVAAVRRGWRTPAGADAPPSTALATSMLTIATSGVLPLADAYARSGERRARASGNAREQLDAALGRLMLDVAHTRWAEVERLVETTLPELRASRSDTLHAAYLGLFAAADLVTGRVARCAERCREMIEVAEHESYLQARGWARNLETTLAMLAGDLEGARRCADEAQAILERRREPEHLAPRALRALCALRAGAIEPAQKEVAELEPLLASELVSVTGLDSYAVPVEVHLATALLGDRAGVARADRSLRALRGYVRQFPIGTPRLMTMTALRARAMGEPSAELFARALAEAARREMPLETLRVLELTGGDATELRERLATGWTAPRSTFS